MSGRGPTLNLYDRFTRDEVSSWVWWPATMVLVVLLVLTFPGQNRATETRRAEATDIARSAAAAVLRPAIAEADVAGPLSGPAGERLDAAVPREVLPDPRVDVVRVWAPDSTLLWSSDGADPVGSAGGLNDEVVAATLDAPTTPTTVASDVDLDGVPSDPTFSVYLPVATASGTVAAQFEVAEATLLADVSSRWLGTRIALGVAALLTLAFALGSMREPVARVGAGVPFAAATLPRGMEVIDVDRKVELERAGAHARDRVRAIEGRLEESEAERVRLEGELQRALTTLQTKTGRPVRSVIARAAEATPSRPARRPSGELVRPAVEEPATLLPADGPVVPASAETMATPEPEVRPIEPAREERAPAAAASEPTPSRSPEPPTRPSSRPPRLRPPEVDVWATSAHEPEREPSPEPEPEPAAGLEPFVPERRSDPFAPERRPSRRPGSAPELVVIPEASEPASGREPEPTAPSADRDADAVSVLERLVEPVEPSAVPAADDPSVIRAKLARTAALKKPGSRREERRRDVPDEPPAS